MMRYTLFLATICTLFGGFSACYAFASGDYLQYRDKLTGDGAGRESLGGTISTDPSGTWLAVSAAGATVDGQPAAGKLYVFHRGTDGTWRLHQRINPPVIQDTGLFGGASLDNQTMIVGAPGIDVPGDGRIAHGEAYVFALDTSTEQWVLQQTLRASDPAPVANFGASVMLDGQIALIAAPGFEIDVEGSDRGAVYVFERDEATGDWEEQQKLLVFGSRWMGPMALDGDQLAVGDQLRRTDDDRIKGSVYIFNRGGDGVFDHVATLESPDETGEGRFGRWVSMHSGELLIGDQQAVTEGFIAGAAWLYRLQQDGEWAAVQRLTPPFLEDDDFNPDHARGGFGSRVLLGHDALYVGAPPYLFARDPGEFGGSDADATGVLYSYRRSADTGLFELHQSLTAPDPGVVSSSGFGTSIAVHGAQILVGAPGANLGGPLVEDGGGAVYMLESSNLDPVDLVTRAEAVPPVVTAREETTYIFHVTNESPDHTATEVILSNPIQARRVSFRELDAMEFVAASDNCGALEENHVVTCDLDTLPPGATAEVSMTVRVNFGFGGRMTHFATALSREPDVNTVNNTVARAVEVLPLEPEPEPEPDPPRRSGGGNLTLLSLLFMLVMAGVAQRRSVGSMFE